jgi:hypothetical protein
MQFTFTCTDVDGSAITKTFNTDYLPSLIDHFDSFVRGCGFFPHGEIRDVFDYDDVVIEEKEEEKEEAEEFPF